MEFSRQKYWDRLHFLLQSIFPNQRLSLYLLCILHWQAQFLLLCHLGSLQVVAPLLWREQLLKQTQNTIESAGVLLFFSWRHTFHTKKCKQDDGDLWTAVQLPLIHSLPRRSVDFPCGSDGKEFACNAGDPGLITGWGRSPGEGNGYQLQYSYPGNSLDRGAWWATVYGVAESDMTERLSLSLFL